MSMDMSKAGKLFDKVKQSSKSKSLELYDDANSKKMTLTELLESYDKSAPDSPLDAFQRQMFLAGVKISGRRSMKMGAMFDVALALTPEFINREIKQGMAMTGQNPNDLIAFETIEEGNSYEPLYITKPSVKGKSPAKTSAGVLMPTLEILYREKVIKMKPYGRNINVDYDVLRLMSSVEFRQILWFLGLNIMEDELGDIYDIAIDGDAAVDAPDPIVAGNTFANLTYKNLLDLQFGFTRPFRISDIMMNNTQLPTLLNLSEFKDPNAFKYQVDGNMITPLGWGSFRYDGGATNRLVSVDRRFFAKKGSSGGMLVEAGLIIERRMEKMAVSQKSGFSIVAEDAVKIMSFS